MRLRTSLTILSLCAAAYWVGEQLRPNPVEDASYVAVGPTRATVSQLPGVVNLHSGDWIFIERKYVLSRYACVTLRHVFNNEFGPIRLPDTSFCHKKGLYVRDTQVQLPPNMPVQFWSYETSEKWSWFYDSQPLADFRVCLMAQGQTRGPTEQCPSRSAPIN